MKEKSELQPIIDAIRCAESPVGMDAVYVHALILDTLARIETRLTKIESQLETAGNSTE
ncbi:MAG: hypothetical protein QF918_00515 [Pirellulaceae bacterium]|jgi:hypothetical protein|nr:hypothetical protein [Pirellulaceae bacterium]MDP6554291.1 hypothetical protein [Pirellulaceae bacterium]MDP6722872.1 hypothetical protein [Pirellulaceae bacterium]